MDTRNLGLEHLVIKYIDLKRLLDIYIKLNRMAGSVG